MLILFFESRRRNTRCGLGAGVQTCALPILVEAVVLGEDGILQAARPGFVLVDSSTAEPGSTRRIGAALAARGADMLDAPLTMTPKEAEAGALNVLVGGEAAVLERLRPAFDAYARNVFHVGALGSAHAQIGRAHV